MGTDKGRTNGASTSPRQHGPTAWQTLQFSGCVTGIYLAYLTQGRVSEELAKHRYGLDQQRFPHLESTIAFQCISCFVWAALLWLLLEGRSGRRLPPRRCYALVGITNVIGPSCGMIALKNISYPAQVLAKSCKSVPIMLVGRLLYRKRYRTLEYLSALAIGAGVGLFALASSATSRGAVHDAQPLLGYSLVAVNLLFDAMTNTGQDEINRAYPDNTSLHLMCWTNFWGALYYGVYLFGVTRSGVEVVAFCMQHRQAFLHLAQFCLCGALGQLAIFYTIATFGSLVCSIVCTTRKFFSILISVVLSGAALTWPQWGAVTLVFGGLLYKSVIRIVPAWSKAKGQ